MHAATEAEEETAEVGPSELPVSARYGELDNVKIMLDAGFPVDYADAEGNTALHMACANGHADVVALLLERGAKHLANGTLNFPAHWAAQNRAKACMQHLLDGVDDLDVLAKNNFGRSVLTEAFATGETDIVAMLLAHDSAAEERMLQAGAGEGGGEGGGAEAAQEGDIVHSFCFGGGDGAGRVRARELVMMRAEDDAFGDTSAEDRTGLGIWSASLVLARWLSALSGTGAFEGKRVLELGAGCGVPGLALAASCASCEVLLTDLNPRTVGNLRDNVALNSAPPPGEEGKAGGPDAARVTAASLDWSLRDTWPSAPPDALIGADLVYSPEIVPLLVKAVGGLLPEGSAGSFYYVAPDTGRAGMPEFLGALEAAGFEVAEELDAPEAYRANPLADGDDARFFLLFQDMGANFKTYRFARR